MADERPFGEVDAALGGFEQHPHMTMVVRGPRHHIVAASAANRAWVPGKDLLGISVADAFPELIGQQIVHLYDECYRTGRP